MPGILLFLFILIFFILFCILTAYSFKQITRARRYTIDECFDYVEDKHLYSREEFDKLEKEEVEILSSDNLTLKGVYLRNDSALKRTIIIVHGYEVSFPWSLQFAGIFLKHGWNVLLIDQRSHGRSEGTYATYGFYEKHDLDLWINWVVAKEGPGATIGLHGQSMGGATVLEYSSINKYASFIIADCPYSDMKKLLKYQIGTLHHLPSSSIIGAVNILLRLKARFDLHNVSPISAIKESLVPTMFIHGSADNFVPVYMSEEMYKVKKGIKKLLIIEGAGHGFACAVDKEKYEAEMINFINEVIS